MLLLNETKHFLKWVWKCAGKQGPVQLTIEYTFYGLMGATIIRNSRILQPAPEHMPDEQEKPQLTNEGKETLGITQQLEAARARKRSIEPCEVPSPPGKEADVD